MIGINKNKTLVTILLEKILSSFSLQKKINKIAGKKIKLVTIELQANQKNISAKIK